MVNLSCCGENAAFGRLLFSQHIFQPQQIRKYNMKFLEEVNETTAQAQKLIEAHKVDAGIARYKRRIRKCASKGGTKIFIPQMLPTSRQSGELVADVLKAEGLKLERTDSGIYVHWG